MSSIKITVQSPQFPLRAVSRDSISSSTHFPNASVWPIVDVITFHLESPATRNDVIILYGTRHIQHRKRYRHTSISSPGRFPTSLSQHLRGRHQLSGRFSGRHCTGRRPFRRSSLRNVCATFVQRHRHRATSQSPACRCLLRPSRASTAPYRLVASL